MGETETLVETLGFAVAILGLCIEAIGLLAIAFYGIRKRLPFSPWAILRLGACLLVAGLATYGFAKTIGN